MYQSADDCMDRSREREQRSLQEEDQQEEDAFPRGSKKGMWCFLIFDGSLCVCVCV